jgi:hypothetical protein
MHDHWLKVGMLGGEVPTEVRIEIGTPDHYDVLDPGGPSLAN